ncbi:MAG: hypothetical protein ACREAM_15660 [Blastocatellia bacterium]
MELNLNNGGMTPSAMALKDSLSQRPDTSSGLMMLTPYQKELLLRAQKEIDERLDRSPRLKSLIEGMRRASAAIESGIESVKANAPEARVVDSL